MASLVFQVRAVLPLQQLHSDFRDFDNRVCCVMKIITIVESNPDIGLLTQRAFCCSPNILARDNKMLTRTLTVASNREGLLSYCAK